MKTAVCFRVGAALSLGLLLSCAGGRKAGGGTAEGVEFRLLEKRGDVYTLASNRKPYTGKFVNGGVDIWREILRDVSAANASSMVKVYGVSAADSVAGARAGREPPDGLNVSGAMADGRLHGEILLTAGGARSTVTYRGGVLHGELKSYRANGTLDLSDVYNEGKPDGKSEAYYENGKIAAVAAFKDGELTGTAEAYHENGKLLYAVITKPGTPGARFELYHENGKRAVIAHMKDGEVNGELELYSDDGVLEFAAVIVNGVIEGDFNIYNSDGTPALKVSMSDGATESVVMFYPNGNTWFAISDAGFELRGEDGTLEYTGTTGGGEMSIFDGAGQPVDGEETRDAIGIRAVEMLNAAEAAMSGLSEERIDKIFSAAETLEEKIKTAFW